MDNFEVKFNILFKVNIYGYLLILQLKLIITFNV
jgi:hypothetical protein